MKQHSNIKYDIGINKLSFSYISKNQKSELKVIDDINLYIKKNEFIVLIGPSACGKTTLLKLIGGLINKTDKHVNINGSIFVKDMKPDIAKKHRCFGFAFQNPVLLPWRNVFKNVLLPIELIRKPTTDDRNQVKSILDIMEISDFALSHPHELSSGQQQRVNIARAMIHKPTILLLDEPFGSLDEVTREKLNVSLHGIQRAQNQTIVFITHSITEAVFLADRIVILSSRPAKIIKIIEIKLANKRTQKIQLEKKFTELLNYVREEFFLKG